MESSVIWTDYHLVAVLTTLEHEEFVVFGKACPGVVGDGDSNSTPLYVKYRRSASWLS